MRKISSNYVCFWKSPNFKQGHWRVAKAYLAWSPFSKVSLGKFILQIMDFSTLFGPECTYSDGSSTLQKLSVLILSKVIRSMKWVGLWKKLTSLLLLSYNMKTSLICCMNGNRTIEVLVSQCKTVFSPLFPSLSSTSSSRGNCTDCRHSPLSYSSAGYRT